MMRYTNFTDEALIDCLRNDDKRAFTELYKRYWKKLFSIAANKLKDLHEAEEVVQDLFVSLWKRREDLQITDSVSAYLATSVKYGVIKVLNKQSLFRQYSDHAASTPNFLDDSTQQWLEFKELNLKLGELIETLPTKCRLVYKLSREDGYTQKKIAIELKISENTVESHIKKSLRFLRQGLAALTLSLFF